MFLYYIKRVNISIFIKRFKKALYILINFIKYI